MWPWVREEGGKTLIFFFWFGVPDAADQKSRCFLSDQVAVVVTWATDTTVAVADD